MKIRNILEFSFLILGTMLFSCSDKNTPEEKVDTELITRVTLLFSPFGDGAPLIFTATDPDGEGPEPLSIDEGIVLNANTTYDLFIDLENSIENQDITTEIETEALDHMFFFEFTEGLFITPKGNGNIDARESQAVIYGDQDSMAQPIGLITSWANGEPANGTFRIVLKHQPKGLKTATSTFNDGATDFDLTWNIRLE